ncbi:hypothetical protein [Methylobacterium aquaticum]|jgi:hypothetical protein|uniref:hypothetical protein n=1 Tax=Methylobacterium aquaticum TaxID=270351 RepID=UPI0012E139C1|nr:hypothetical protein [Methylobacterium aquaticum]
MKVVLDQIPTCPQQPHDLFAVPCLVGDRVLGEELRVVRDLRVDLIAPEFVCTRQNEALDTLRRPMAAEVLQEVVTPATNPGFRRPPLTLRREDDKRLLRSRVAFDVNAELRIPTAVLLYGPRNALKRSYQFLAQLLEVVLGEFEQVRPPMYRGRGRQAFSQWHAGLSSRSIPDPGQILPLSNFPSLERTGEEG